MNSSNQDILLNKEICEFIGAFIGDGYLGNYGDRKNQYLIGLAGDKRLDKSYFESVLLPIINRNFPFTNPRVRYREDENTIMIRVYSKKLFLMMKKLGFSPGKKSSTVTIPIQITGNDKYMNSTLRGIFDTDGSVFFDKRGKYNQPYPRITLQSASLGLINQIENYLSKNFKLYVYKANRDGYRNCIEIYGHSQLEKFLKGIGFSNQRHLSKCLCSSVVER